MDNNGTAPTAIELYFQYIYNKIFRFRYFNKKVINLIYKQFESNFIFGIFNEQQIDKNARSTHASTLFNSIEIVELVFGIVQIDIDTMNMHEIRFVKKKDK